MSSPDDQQHEQPPQQHDQLDQLDQQYFDDLDKLSIFHSTVQVLVLIIGLVVNEDNGVAILAVVFILSAAAMAGSEPNTHSNRWSTRE